MSHGSDTSGEQAIEISFIIPTLNEELCLQATLEALCRYKERVDFGVEIIVVDGGSSDSTLSIAESLAGSVLMEPPIRGTIARARNIGASAARGRLLVHMDADSRIPFIDELMDRIGSDTSNGEWAIATVRLEPWPWDSRAVDVWMHRLMNTVVSLLLPLGGWFAKGEFQAMTRDAFAAAGGYNERLTVGEDCDMFCRMKSHGGHVFLKQFAVYHSPRRFRKLGYPRVFGSYLREAVWFALFRRNYLVSWREVR